MRHAAIWLLGGALTLTTGVLSLHAVALSAAALHFPIGYDPIALLSSWLTGFVLSALGLFIAYTQRINAYFILGGGALLTSAIVLPQVLALAAVGFDPGLAWSWEWMFVGLVVAFMASSLVVGVQALWTAEHPLSWLRLPLSTLLLTLALWWSQTQIITAARFDDQVSSLHAHQLSLHTLELLATFGTMILLVMMWFSSFIETRMQASLREAASSLEKQNATDQLTGLPNRLFFEEHMARAAHHADNKRERLALLFIDLDGFRPLNESFGHRFGDSLLKGVSQRLLEIKGEGDILARLGADEFLLLLTQDMDKEDVSARARDLIGQLSLPIQVDDREVTLPASIGIALFPSDGAQSTLIAHANAAVQAAKASGGDTYCFFEPHMMQDAREKVELLRDLRNALANQELELYYQPKIHAPSGEITGAEALLRWKHPVRGLISPAVFIPIAERYGLINPIGNWVIDQACQQIRAWRDGGLRMRVAINLSAQQLRQSDLQTHIEAALKRYDINPVLLTCEITESIAMEDTESTHLFFSKLAAIGVHISIDDFGTGYSSLAHLRKLPAEELKIDRSFVQDLENSNDARTVVDAVVKLGQALGLKVVAEGVETEEQNQILSQLGCNELQGFLFAKPMAAQMLYMWAKNDIGPTTRAFRSSLFQDTQLPSPLDPA